MCVFKIGHIQYLLYIILVYCAYFCISINNYYYISWRWWADWIAYLVLGGGGHTILVLLLEVEHAEAERKRSELHDFGIRICTSIDIVRFRSSISDWWRWRRPKNSGGRLVVVFQRPAERRRQRLRWWRNNCWLLFLSIGRSVGQPERGGANALRARFQLLRDADAGRNLGAGTGNRPEPEANKLTNIS